MSRVFVTGGSGFIGTNLVHSLAEQGCDVMSFDRKPPLNCGHQKFHRTGDILDSKDVLSALQAFRPELVVHLAARCDLNGSSQADYTVNTTGVQNVISAIRKVGSIERVIFASSRYVHSTEKQPDGDDEYSPFTEYGFSKAEGEKIVRAHKLQVPWVIARPTSIWGPWFGVPYRGFFDAVRRGIYVHPRGEGLFKTYGYVGNVVHQLMRFMSVPEDRVNRRTFYVGDYQPLEIREMAETIREAFDAPPVRDVPIGVLRFAAAAGDVFKKFGWQNPPLTSFRLSNLRTQMVYDLSATQNIAGACPYTTKDGIRATVDWIKQYG